ncbi:MAG TPA: squalene/phytoene synthase family protein, partial [Rhodanobacter sp.]
MSEPAVVHGGALQSYVDKWLAVQPAQRVALAFVDPAKYPGHVALAALEQELLSAAYGIREPQVALGKLNWWAEELSGAAASGGRHPLTQALFDDERAHAIAAERWLAPVLAARAQLEEGTAADFPAQLAAAGQLHGALAALETAWWYGDAAPAERAARVAVLSHLLYALRRLEDDAERDRLPLPMARLARHGLDRAGLRRRSAARD